ncbi:MAG: ABC transporter permease [Chloroflexi bacterium]|nr:MAG: ABC transporter permease [Chloroflexota bacterium]TMC30243.1 MAG: ABC transporter permease [Chloroflexota bacterium]TMC33387.1 MAG: ABC transporter permease [Chloroflexota bacterium]TMC56097.1 MAG: ABC transporter permease [Chloroflexota bacterium]TME43406.1 MAG: ABC transporter permease [Chloroflexota bacterium]
MISALNGQIGLAYAFVEREIALSKRYWAWEIVWLVYGIVTSLSVAYIGLAAPAISGGQVDEAAVSHFVLYLLVGTIAWRFLGIIFENIGEVIAWERWEGTIEYTFMSPVPRLTHLLGMCGATLVRSVTFSIAILAAVALFVPVDLSKANALSAVVLLAVGALAFIGLGIASASFPLMWTEKGLQMAYIVQAVVLLVSGVYYPVEVLPGWMQLLATISPATYVIRGMRAALMDGADLATLWPEIWPALIVGVLSIPLGLRLFIAVERYAKRTGRLKRSG